MARWTVSFLVTLKIVSSFTTLQCYCQSQQPRAPFLCTKLGAIRGETITIGGRRVRAFYGIPFAKPPTGRRRFMKPIPASPWSTTLDVTLKRASCFQGRRRWRSSKRNDNFTHDLDVSEDCLHLNVWAPRRSADAKAVMVFIYGGGFQWGSNNWPIYDGRFLSALGDVVVVVPNYRLGVMGFLNGRTRDAPGNAGIWDVLLALRWVKENIHAFGGDPKSITLMGESAGAAITGLLMISPLSEGLFHRAIMQSGSPYWNVGNVTLTGHTTIKMMSLELKCPVSSLSEALGCLRRVDASQLVNAASSLFGSLPRELFPSDIDELFPEAHISMIEQGYIHKVQLLCGVNENEGAFFAFLLISSLFGKTSGPSILKHTLVTLVTTYLRIIFQTSPSSLVDRYFGTVPKDDEELLIRALSRLAGDIIINCPVVYFADAVSKDASNEVYFYRFMHRPSISEYPDWVGATHTSELSFVLASIFHFPDDVSQTDLDVSRELVHVWSTFARTG